MENIPKTMHPLVNADPEDIQAIKSAIKEVRQKAIEGFRQAGAVVQVTAENSKILVVTDHIQAGTNENNGPLLIIEGHDISDDVKTLNIRVDRNTMQPLEITVVFRPKISIVKRG